MAETLRPQNECIACGHRWFPRGHDLSEACPRCGGEVRLMPPLPPPDPLPAPIPFEPETYFWANATKAVAVLAGIGGFVALLYSFRDVIAGLAVLFVLLVLFSGRRRRR